MVPSSQLSTLMFVAPTYDKRFSKECDETGSKEHKADTSQWWHGGLDILIFCIGNILTTKNTKFQYSVTSAAQNHHNNSASTTSPPPSAGHRSFHHSLFSL
ncbi:hypothetical protein QVD17_04818 [Tagetes erecta]|uniref:Uncharacterized protein n=1 Tax=Tagetes erecta TaxID=13708 RepID=A0AAD8LDD4_TARER|nr:hypothetical protein QVD17_04818 [Tagetes erecta]